MFVFETNYTFEWPVKVRYPANGSDEVREFTGVFRLPEDELEIYGRSDGAEASIQAVITSVRERLARYWIGWTDIETRDGGQLSFSEGARAKLLRQRPVREAVDRALSEAVLGMREKN